MDTLILFTNSKEEAKQVAEELHNVGCCPRCILRFLGELRAETYSAQPQDLEKMLLSEQLWTSTSDVTSDAGICPCPACLGILQKFASKPFFLQIEEAVKKAGYEFSSQQCSLILPVSLIPRQKAIFLHLQKRFRSVYPGKEEGIPSVKDVWKWSCGRQVAEILHAQFQVRSPFDILMTFSYADSDKECAFLLDADPDTFRKRKQRKFGFETFTRANVTKALAQMSDSKFEDNFTCPPKLPSIELTCEIKCSHDAIFIAGRYLKYSRELSQTPWLVDGKRIMEDSVQELICKHILELFAPKDHRLSSSGREDVDVRMLGLGRPFVIELIDPHRVKASPEDIRALQQKINGSTKDVQVRDLQMVSREDIDKLKEGEIDKCKTYSALCWCERELTDEDLNMLMEMKDLTIHQKTPLRVLHRRSSAVRDRLIHQMKVTKLLDNKFKLSLKTQAGTYIKEFVHGDFGRTTPNLSELLGAECDIIDLDVEAVEVDWPPFIDPISDESCDLFENQVKDNNKTIDGETVAVTTASQDEAMDCEVLNSAQQSS